MVAVIILSLIVFFVTKKIFRKMILINISPEVAQSQGISIGKYNFIYLCCVALAVGLGVRVVGGLMTAALVAIPACASRNLSNNFFQYSYGALLIGLISALFGITLFKLTGLPAGPMIIISSSFFFVFSLALKQFLPKD